MSNDSRILLVQERLENDLALGESHFREFKSALEGADRKRRRKVSLVARDIGETLVAFANADGGTLIVGAEDDGTVSGVAYAQDKLEVLRNAPKTHVYPGTPLPGVRTQLVSIGDKTVLVFEVQKGTRYIHLTSDGRCLQRRDTETVPVASEQIQFERHEQLSREYDRQWIDRATMADLGPDLLARVAETVAPGMSSEKSLQTLGLAEFVAGSLRLRAAALLLFSLDMGKWHPRSEIRLQQIAGSELLTGADYNVIRDETYAGNVLQLLSEGWERIRGFLVQKRLAGGTFQFQTSYPEDACREAFVNAVAHRDYSIEGRSIEVLVFNDRLVIRNPGRLLSTVKLSELRQGAGVHDSRNTYIARVLRELGYMQEMGEGIRRISSLMNGHELAPPEIDSVDHSFQMAFSQRNIFTPVEQRWLDAFAEFNLSREEKVIVLLGRGGKLISTNQIWEALDLVDTEEYRRVIAQLQTKGLLYSEIKKSAAASAARRQRISIREVPRFAIRVPDIVLKSQREVVDALISIGRQRQIGMKHYERVRDNLSDQNLFRSTDRVRKLLRWLELVEPGGTPTDRLGGMWPADEDAPVDTDGGKPGVAATSSLASVTPVKDIYVGNLDPETSEQEVLALFETVGTVVNVSMPKDYLTGRNRGYAFVWMSDSSTSQRAFAAITGRLLRNRPVKLGWSYRQKVRAKSRPDNGDSLKL